MMRAALTVLLFSLLAASVLGRGLSQSDVKKMGETHSGAAAGVVTPAAADNKGSEKKIGGWGLHHHRFPLSVWGQSTGRIRQLAPQKQ